MKRPGARRLTEAWQSEFWSPQVTDAALSLVTQLAKKAAWLPDESVQDFAHAVPQVSDQLCQPEARTANQLSCPAATPAMPCCSTGWTTSCLTIRRCMPGLD